MARNQVLFRNNTWICGLQHLAFEPICVIDYCKQPSCVGICLCSEPHGFFLLLHIYDCGALLSHEPCFLCYLQQLQSAGTPPYLYMCLSICPSHGCMLSDVFKKLSDIIFHGPTDGCWSCKADNSTPRKSKSSFQFVGYSGTGMDWWCHYDFSFSYHRSLQVSEWNWLEALHLFRIVIPY